MKINNKGFTLIEVLAVIVILGVISTIMISATGSMLKQSKEDNYDNLEKSIKSAAKIYLSDNRYDITLGGSCSDSNIRTITSIKEETLSTPSRITLKTLVDEEVLSTNKNNKIINPLDNKEINLDNSYIIVEYNCTKKDYDYGNVVIY